MSIQTRIEPNEMAAVVAALAGTRPFGDLDDDRRRQVAEAGQLVTVVAGATVVAEEEPSTGIYILLDGRADVTVTVEGDHVRVGDVLVGDSFGELATLLGQARTATVVATEPSRLLYLSTDAIRTLLGHDAEFGLALARDVAGRLQVALGEDNAHQATSGPGRVDLPAQDLTQLGAYQRRYYASAVRNLVKRHRLLVDREFPSYRTSFRVTRDEQQRWFDLFDVRNGQRATPFTYHTSSGTLLLMKIVEDVGVNFRHLMHLRSTMALHPEGRRIEPDVDHLLEASLEDVVALGEDRVALVLETRVHAPDDTLLQLNRESFVILSIDPDAMAALQASSRFGEGDTEGLTGLAKREPTLDHATSTTVRVRVPEDMGARYGKVSGDLNVVHTTRMAARLFGHPRPFVQGLCTANHVLRTLTGALPAPVQHFDISFARRIFVDQDVDIRFDDRTFEVFDEGGKLAAFGSHRAAGAT